MQYREILDHLHEELVKDHMLRSIFPPSWSSLFCLKYKKSIIRPSLFKTSLLLIVCFAAKVLVSALSSLNEIRGRGISNRRLCSFLPETRKAFLVYLSRFSSYEGSLLQEPNFWISWHVVGRTVLETFSCTNWV